MIHRPEPWPRFSWAFSAPVRYFFACLMALGNGVAKRQIRGDGGAQRASGAVRVRIIDTRAIKPGHGSIRLGKHIVGILGAMTTLDQRGTAITLHEAVAGGLHILLIANQRIGRTSASGMFGVTTVAIGNSLPVKAAMASSLMRLAPEVATITGSSTMFVA